MARYADNAFRYVVAVYSKAETGRQFNVTGHALLGLRDKVAASRRARLEDFETYQTKDGVLRSSISRWPVIALKTDRAGLLRRLFLAAVERGVPVNAVLEQMIDVDHATQVANTAAISIEESRFLCVAAFEKNGELADITRKMSLMR